MQIKHIALMAGSQANIQEDDWIIVNVMTTSKTTTGSPVSYITLVRGQAKETLDFIRSIKGLQAAEILHKLEQFIETASK